VTASRKSFQPFILQYTLDFMNQAGVFGIVGLGAVVGAVAGAMALGKNKGRGRVKGQAPYAAIGAGVIATGAAYALYNISPCGPCPAGTVAAGAPSTAISQGGYTAAVALASAVGAVAGAMAVAKQKPNKLLGQQPYAPIGGALAGAGLAAILYPTAVGCQTCVPTTSTPTSAPAAPVSNLNTTPTDQSSVT
jgi:hypothetical protein